MKTTLLTALLSISVSLVTQSGYATDLFFELRFFGDVDGDQQVTVEDAIAVQEYLYGDGAEPPCSAYVDVNGDGYVSPLDVLQILSWAIGAKPHPSPAYRLGHTLDVPDVMYPIVHGWAEGDWNADGTAMCGPSREELEALELEPVATSATVSRLDDGQPLVELAIDPRVLESRRAVDARVGSLPADGANARLVKLEGSDGSIAYALGIWINQGEIPAEVTACRLDLD